MNQPTNQPTCCYRGKQQTGCVRKDLTWLHLANEDSSFIAGQFSRICKLINLLEMQFKGPKINGRDSAKARENLKESAKTE